MAVLHTEVVITADGRGEIKLTGGHQANARMRFT